MGSRKKKRKKKNQRDHSDVKNSQMLVFKMESGGHKLKSKASLSKVGRASRKVLALSTFMLVHWDPCWTSDFQKCKIIGLWCLNLCVCGNVLWQQSKLNICVYHWIFLKVPSTLDLYTSSACSVLMTISRLWL